MASMIHDIKQTHFRLENDDAKKPTLVSCGTKWKAFKTTLRGEYMLKNISPIKKWTFIEPHVWKEFCRIENTPEKHVCFHFIFYYYDILLY